MNKENTDTTVWQKIYSFPWYVHLLLGILFLVLVDEPLKLLGIDETIAEIASLLLLLIVIFVITKLAQEDYLEQGSSEEDLREVYFKPRWPQLHSPWLYCFVFIALVLSFIDKPFGISNTVIILSLLLGGILLLLGNVKSKESVTLNALRRQSDLEDGFVLLDFWASWCQPCHKMRPVLESIADDFSELTVLTLDIEEESNKEIVEEYNVQSIPTLILFKDGKEVERFHGALPKRHLQKQLKKHLL